MATLKERIQEDLHAAMRAREETRKSALRMLTAAVKNAEIETRGELDDAGVAQVIQKQAKQRRESILEFRKGNREDLVAKEEAELVILEAYLPAQAGRDEVEAAARKLVAETGASGPRDIGKVMPPLVKQFAGRADGRLINEVVRELLGS
ncbi:MAG: GatB/YqeY domain-containing protein [Chloroflexi bacterium]|nr:GatB/YqeY domain-containing protein [Chloroflexota bacterium]